MSRISQARDGVWTPQSDEFVERRAGTGSRIKQFLLGPYPTLVSRLVLGGIFLLAGLMKLGVPRALVESINSYQLDLPAQFVQTSAVVMPVLEIGLGLWLLVGLFTRFSALVSGAMMVVFLVALVQATVRGLDISCGCFGGPTSNPIGLAAMQALGPVGVFLANEKADIPTIIRDVVLVMMAAHLFFFPTIFAIDNWRNRRNQEAYVEIDSPVEDDEQI